MPMFVTPHAAEIWSVSDFFTSDECSSWIARAEEMGLERAGVKMRGGQQMNLPGVRNNDRAIFDDPRLAADLWERMKPFVPDGPRDVAPIGLNERFRIYKYSSGQQFKKHRDGTETFPPRVVDGVLLPTGRTHTTVLIYLNDDCVGGETAFFDDAGQETVRVTPECGGALLFAHNILHEGRKVEDGVKYVLRTDVIYETRV